MGILRQIDVPLTIFRPTKIVKIIRPQDGYFRLANTEPRPDEQTRTAIGFTHRMVPDDGACYRVHAFATVLRGTPP